MGKINNGVFCKRNEECFGEYGEIHIIDGKEYVVFEFGGKKLLEDTIILQSGVYRAKSFEEEKADADFIGNKHLYAIQILVSQGVDFSDAKKMLDGTYTRKISERVAKFLETSHEILALNTNAEYVKFKGKIK